jgi:dipeptidase E
MTRRILLMSSSRKDQLGYLEHAGEQIHVLLKHESRKVLFVPFAAVTFSFDSYEDLVKPAFKRLGYSLESIHRSDDPLAAIEQAGAIAIGGGNTFALLKRLYDAGIVDAMRAKVMAGTPYMGWSAGSNVASPTIRTTNDMPVVQPPTLGALGLVPFQVNPHFISGKPVGHNGEKSREERLAEFLAINAPEQVLALPEGSALYSDGTHGTVRGERHAVHFLGEGRVETLRENEMFPLTRIKGLADISGWPAFRG